MPEPTTRSSSRNWADILAIVTGVALLAISVWPSDVTASSAAAREAGAGAIVLFSHIAAGVAAIAAVFVAQRWSRRPLARGLLVAGALVLLGALLFFRDFGPRALWTMLLPAILLLVSASAVGPVPRD